MLLNFNTYVITIRKSFIFKFSSPTVVHRFLHPYQKSQFKYHEWPCSSPRSTSTNSRRQPHHNATAFPVTAATATTSLPASSTAASLSLVCTALTPPAPTRNPEAWRGPIKFTFTFTIPSLWPCTSRDSNYFGRVVSFWWSRSRNRP